MTAPRTTIQLEIAAVVHVLVLVHRRVVAAHGKALVVLPALVILH